MVDPGNVLVVYGSIGGMILVVGVMRAGYRNVRGNRGVENEVMGVIMLGFAWPFALLTMIVVGPLWLLFKLGEWKRRNDDGGKS